MIGDNLAMVSGSGDILLAVFMVVIFAVATILVLRDGEDGE